MCGGGWAGHGGWAEILIRVLVDEKNLNVLMNKMMEKNKPKQNAKYSLFPQEIDY